MPKLRSKSVHRLSRACARSHSNFNLRGHPERNRFSSVVRDLSLTRCESWSTVPGQKSPGTLAPDPERRTIHRESFFARSIAPPMSFFRNVVSLDLTPSPAARYGGLSAGAIQRVFLRRMPHGRNHIRSVPVRTQPHQITSAALRALHAMSNPRRHTLGPQRPLAER